MTTQQKTTETTRLNGVPYESLSFQGPGTYRIRFRGSLAEHWFEGLGDIRSTIGEADDRTPVTTLVGRFRDQAALLGMLNTIYDLHLPLLEVEYLEDAPPAGEASGNKGVPPG